MPYAYCRKLDPATGDVVFDRTRSSWTQGHPATEVALRALRTMKGSAARDPNEGIDLTDIDLGSPNASAVVERRINDALAKYVRMGLFSIVDLKVDIVGDAAIWHLVIRDPREGELPPLEGTF
jgi:hypothetical protein